MPSSLNNPREHSMQLHFKKKSGKWSKRNVVLKKSSDDSQKYYLDVHRPHRPVARVITRKFSSDLSVRIDISPHSHAVVRDTAEDKICKLLCLLPLKSAKQPQPCYQFAAYCEQEFNNLENLANSVENLCEVTSFEASVDADSNSFVPSGPVLLHIYKHTACLTSRSPCIRILHHWELIEPLAEFQWERYGFRITDHQHSNEQCFLFVNSQDDIKKIQKEITSNCKKLYSGNSMLDVIPGVTTISPDDATISGSCLPIIIPMDPTVRQTGSSLHLNEPSEPLRTSSSSETLQVPAKRRSTINTPVKEHVVIRYPDHQPTRRCNSDTSIIIPRQHNKDSIKISKSHSFNDTQNSKNISHELEMVTLNRTSQKTESFEVEKKNTNSAINYSLIQHNSVYTDQTEDCQPEPQGSNIQQQDLSQYYANVQLRPKFYMYMNITREDMEREAPNTYVNIFSGSSFKGCYENWQHQSSIYSTIPAILPPPPLPPRPCPPRLPPRRQIHLMDNFCHDFVPQRPPPPLPPKPRSPAHLHSEPCAAPRIQVALFAATPVSGRVWFLRVAFMHQDLNDTTFKRVKDIEAFSNHRLLKTNSVEVTTDITIDVTVNSKQGFFLLNGHQQNIELNDIQDLRMGDWFIVEFHIQNSDIAEDHLIGNVSISPKTTSICRRACKADMGIDEIFQRKVIVPVTLGTQPRTSLLSDYNKRQNLCRKLDIFTQSHDWRQVAGSLGFTHAEIMELQDKACRSVQFSPTDEVLKIWEQREPNCSLEQLVNILRELGRLDVVQDLGYSITLES